MMTLNWKKNFFLKNISEWWGLNLHSVTSYTLNIDSIEQKVDVRLQLFTHQQKFQHIFHLLEMGVAVAIEIF